MEFLQQILLPIDKQIKEKIRFNSRAEKQEKETLR